jgi:hypothetical protein
LQKIEIDHLPSLIKNSKNLRIDHLPQLALVPEIPSVDPSFEDNTLKNIFQYYSLDPDEMENELHIYAASLLDEGKVKEAWQVLLALA